MALTVILCVAVLAYANALTIGPIENVTTPLRSVWEETYPDSSWPGHFDLTYGDGQLWIVAKQPDRGIVSRLRVSTKEWDHKPFNLSIVIGADCRFYSQKGQLFMLVKEMDNNNLQLSSFYWVHASSSWSKVPLEVEDDFSKAYASSRSYFHIALPTNEDNVVYVVVSTGLELSSPSEFEFGYGKMEVTFSGSRPVKSTVKKIVRQKVNEKVNVHYTGVSGGKLVSLVNDAFGPQNNTRWHKTTYTADLVTKQLNVVNLTGDHPPSDFGWYYAFRLNQDEIFVGGITGVAPDVAQVQYDIWTLHMKNMQWKKAKPTFRFGAPISSRLAYDEKEKKMYVARSETGIHLSIAKVSD